MTQDWTPLQKQLQANRFTWRLFKWPWSLMWGELNWHCKLQSSLMITHLNLYDSIESDTNKSVIDKWISIKLRKGFSPLPPHPPPHTHTSHLPMAQGPKKALKLTSFYYPPDGNIFRLHKPHQLHLDFIRSLDMELISRYWQVDIYI